MDSAKELAFDLFVPVFPELMVAATNAVKKQ